MSEMVLTPIPASFPKGPIVISSAVSQSCAAMLLREAISGSSLIACASDICASLVSTTEVNIALGYRPTMFAGVASRPNNWGDDEANSW